MLNLTENSLEALVLWLIGSGSLATGLALERARNAYLDTLACCVAGAHDPVAECVFQAARHSGAGMCSIVGRNEALTAESAALVNGTAAHALDFDDNFNPAVTHASAILVPCLLALGQEIDASGQMLLDAYIAGLEVQAWLGRRMIPAHYAAGWHATSTIGTIGAAAACARLLRLAPDRIQAALSIATSMAGGSKAQFGTMVKPLHVGLAARNGITAVWLAASGVTGIDDPFSGEWGFVKLHHGDELRMQKVGENTAQGLAIISDGLAQKKFPCCASAHRTMDAVIDLMSNNALNPDEIEIVETLVPDYDYRNMRYNRPANEMEARFSMPYCVAVIAIYGRMTLADFTMNAVARPEVRKWLPKISMSSMESDGGQTKAIWEEPAITTIVLRSGKRFYKEVFQPVGTIHSPMNDEDLAAKFYSCVERSLKKQQSEMLYRLIKNMENECARDLAFYMRKN